MVAVLVASGTSLKKEEVEYCRGKATVYVINDNYKIAPWADHLYACDEEWWDYHNPDFDGQKWTINENAAKKYNLNLVTYDSSLLFSEKEPIATGNNSGFQAINLAYIHGHRRALLLGYDYHNLGNHWFGKHPHQLNKTPDMTKWIRHMRNAAPLMFKANYEVINCNPDSAIDAFPKMSIYEAL